MHPAASRVTLSDDKEKTPLTKEELFEALDEYNSALEKCKELEEGSQKAAKERKYRLLRRNIEKEIEILLLKEAERDRNFQKEVDKGFAKDADEKEKEALNVKPEDETTEDDQNALIIKRLMNITISLKTDIADRKKKINSNYFSKPDDSLTEEQEIDREVDLQAEVNTIKQLLASYKTSHSELVKLTPMGDQKTLLLRMNEAIADTEHVIAMRDVLSERKKDKIKFQASAKAKDVAMANPFSGESVQKYLDWFVFSEEFRQVVLERDYSEIDKLRILKSNTTGEANAMISEFYRSEDAINAFQLLDKTYGSADMIIRESFRNIQRFKAVSSEYDVKQNNALLTSMKINLSTLTTYGAIDPANESMSTETANLLVELERKIPYETYLKWQEKKEDLEEDEKEPTIKRFIKFYEKKIKHQSEAQYLRPERKAHPSTTPTGGTNNRGGYGQQRGRGGYFNRGGRGAFKSRHAWNQYSAQMNMDGRRDGRNISQGNPGIRDSFSPSVYCIWCEVNDHSSQKCLNRQYSFDDKIKKAKKHNACFCCLQTTDHTYENCPQKRRCHICSPIGVSTGNPMYHSHYLHSRAEFEKYLKNNPGRNRGRSRAHQRGNLRALTHQQ